MVRSFRLVLVVAPFWLILAGSIYAQQSNQQPPSGPQPVVPNLNSEGTRIAIMYTDFFYDPNNGISRLVNAIRSLDQEFQSRKTELQRLQQRIEKLTNETSGSGPGVSSTAFQTKLSELEELKKDSQRKAEDAQAEYSKRLHDALNPIFEDLDKAITSFAQQRGIGLIFDGSKMDDALLYISDGLDLSHAFIVEFNRANPPPPVASPR